MNYENMKQFCDRFNRIAEDPTDLSLEDKQFLQFYETELAMALIKDIGPELSLDIAKIMTFLCERC